MAKRSREELEKLMAELEEELNSPDDDEVEEVWVRTPDGYETKLTGEKAKRFLAKHNKLWAEDEVAQVVEPKKRAVAKKTASPVKKVVKASEEEVEDLEEELEEALEEDASPRKTSFWG